MFLRQKWLAKFGKWRESYIYFNKLSAELKARYNQKLAKAGLKRDPYVICNDLWTEEPPSVPKVTCVCTWYVHPVIIPKWK